MKDFLKILNLFIFDSSWLCPDKPNVTNNIVCSSCGGAGHISKDCRSKRPGQGGPTSTNNQAKIDEEYLSLMAELGEVQPNSQENNSNGNTVQQPNRSFSIFDNRQQQQQAPRPLMAPPPLMGGPPNTANAPPMPPWSQNQPPQQSMIPPLMGINTQPPMPPLMGPGPPPSHHHWPPPGPPPPCPPSQNNPPPPPGKSLEYEFTLKY